MRLIIILLLAEIGNRQIRKQIDEASLCLRDQRISICQKQNISHPSLFQKDFAECDDRACFSRSGRHDQQRLPPVPAAKAVTYSLDCGLLIIASGYILIDINVLQAAAHLLQIKQLLQIPLRVDRGYFSLRILVVHNARIESICQEDNRTSALLFSNQIRIQAGLLSGFGHIDACTLRLDHRQYVTIITEQDIVCIPYLRFVGHSRDLIFIDPVLALNPSGITQHCINIDLARRILRYIERLGNIRLLLLLTASRQLLPQRFIFLDQLLQFDLCLRIHDQDRRLLLLVKELGVEFSLFIMVRIAIRHKIQEVK